jgi:hypothetical protein
VFREQDEGVLAKVTAKQHILRGKNDVEGVLSCPAKRGLDKRKRGE